MLRKAALRQHAIDTSAMVPAEDWVDTVKKSGKSKHILEINQDFHRQYPEPEAIGRGEFHLTGEAAEMANKLEEKVQALESSNGYTKGRSAHLANATVSDSRGIMYYIRYVKAPFDEEPRAVKVFNYLQILSACFLAFSHGSNDTANSVGPLVGLFVTYHFGLASYDTDNNPDMEYVILFGALSMLVGLWVMGHRVIKTIGKDLTDITAPSGFAMSLGTAFTVLFASKIGIPVSTTHCMVGAVLCVGIARSNPKGVSWKVFRNIVFAWLVTTPVAGLVSAGVAWVLAHFILGTY
uniref:Phosphate transporter n=1 Tax=Plectus sambesii TaxID=2011161 RepID=A0A914WHD0_9BILA